MTEPWTVGDSVICGNSSDQINGGPINDGGGNVIGTICPPPAPECPGDIDNDGEVGITDFLKVLANWGPCP